jgi:serine/threonine protein phosphatase PrpC
MNREVQPLSLRIGAGVNRGKVRQENQDRISRFRCPLGEVFIIADGMGGYEGGALAAEMTIALMERALQAIPPGADPNQALQAAAQQTNAEIHRQAGSGDPQKAKMGATTVLALVNGRRVIVGHIGDSRAYLLHEGQLSRLTRDHTVVQRMLDHNMLSEQEAREHPDASVITRALGHKPQTELELAAPLDLGAGDKLLLCSDGLCGYVGDAAIQPVLASAQEAQQITDQLIELALAAGGEDNVSVQVLVAQETPGAANLQETPELPRSGKPAPRSRMAVVAALISAFVFGALVSRFWTWPAPPGFSLWPTQDPPPAAGASPGKPAEGPGPTAAPAPKIGVFVVGDGVQDAMQRLRALDPSLSIRSVDPPFPSGFEAGNVYYRDGYNGVAQRIADALRRDDPAQEYVAVPWPMQRRSSFRDAVVLVASQQMPSAPGADRLSSTSTDDSSDEPSPAESGTRPELSISLRILSPADAKVPGEAERRDSVIPADLQRRFQANWSAPQAMDGDEVAALAPGHVYFRPESEPQARELARLLAYQAERWPTALSPRWPSFKVLVVLRSPAPPTTPPKRTE